MKKVIITILGIIGHEKVDYIIEQDKIKKIFTKKVKEDEPNYFIGNKLKKTFNISEEKYVNMFDLLSSNFDTKIVAIGTKKAIEIQKQVLVYKGVSKKNIEYVEIQDEKQYNEILELLNNQIEKYDRVIFDVSHGFRHLPILSTVALIMQNIQDSSKIEELIYAKEIEAYKKYEIVTLKEYLELAKLSYVLNSFEINYTIGNDFDFNNENYQNLVDNLRIISTHILANSIKQIIGQDNSISKTISILQKLQEKDKNIFTFKKSIDNIIKYLRDIQNLDSKDEYIQLFELSKAMNSRGYLLNSITLLNEAVGFYCVDIIKNIDKSLNNHIDRFKRENGNIYELAHQSKNVIKLQDRFSFPYLSQDLKLSSGQKTFLQKKKKKLKEKLNIYVLEEIKNAGFEVSLTKIEGIKEKPFKNLILNFLDINSCDSLRELIYKIEALRNNLAHANSSDKVNNVKSSLSKVLRNFETIIKDGV